ncbi:MAG TPA: glycosyltransferase [Candidatus Dependentiae bacterium]|nr:glycosyltransferase [Candidatus Dependentiae bacterium]HRQ63137.1 glycosyltransferase [Candidatus Dependentiae bacterium]
MKLSIIIPAYNEERRIRRTLQAYHQFFTEVKRRGDFDFELVVVLNGCKDNTLGIVQEVASSMDNLYIIDTCDAGKGLAIKLGFADALTRDSDVIGFVDADMATAPEAFDDLVINLDACDGVIASRYMSNSVVYPPRPWIKRWGSRLIYESLVWLLFGLQYDDLQCGAKVFKRHTLQQIVPGLRIRQWAFDVELLCLCKRNGFVIKEHPTVWHDQTGSKLTLRSGFYMLGSIVKLRLRYSPLRFLFKQ